MVLNQQFVKQRHQERPDVFGCHSCRRLHLRARQIQLRRLPRRSRLLRPATPWEWLQRRCYPPPLPPLPRHRLHHRPWTPSQSRQPPFHGDPSHSLHPVLQRQRQPRALTRSGLLWSLLHLPHPRGQAGLQVSASQRGRTLLQVISHPAIAHFVCKSDPVARCHLN